MRALLSLLVIAFACLYPVVLSAGNKMPLLETKTPQGLSFKLGKELRYPAALDQLDEIAAKAGKSVKGSQLALRRVKEQGHLRWFACSYEIGEQLAIWQAGQNAWVVFSGGSELAAEEIFAITPGMDHTPVALGKTTKALSLDDLFRVNNNQQAIVIYAGFPMDFKVHTNGKPTAWSRNDILAVRIGQKIGSTPVGLLHGR